MQHSEMEEIKRHFDVIVESLREDIRAIAEGHGILAGELRVVQKDLNALREQNEKEHKELRREIISVREDLNTLREGNEKEHREILSEIKSSYAGLNHRVSVLEKR